VIPRPCEGPQALAGQSEGMVPHLMRRLVVLSLHAENKYKYN